MSTIVATTVGLAVATTAVVVLVSLANGGQTTKQNPLQIRYNKTFGNYVDPNGPDVQFILFTRYFPPVNLKIGDTNTLNTSGFNNSHSTKIIIHGFLSSINEEIFIINKNAYLDTGDYNVIGMDWSVLCQFEYFSAMRGVQIAGKNLSDFINWLDESGVPLDSIHLIGHSMGAHVAATAGNKIKNGKVARITGLDPAGPGYVDMRPEYKLDRNDAQLVDVIHTYMKILSLAQPLGHYDFYPNGGRFQPGCPDIYDLWRVPESLLCNHARAYYFFAETIRNTNGFKCLRCNSVNDALNLKCKEETDVYMGQIETYKNPGLFFVRTRDRQPFSL